MENLKRLKPNARKLISRDFLYGEIEKPSGIEDYLEKIDVNLDIRELDKEILWIVNNLESNSTEIDSTLAPPLHKILNINRRIANDYGIWRYLAVVKYPDFVRFRWANSDGKVTKSRFWGYKRRQEFCRLWWVAEMTVLDGDYSLTKTLLSDYGQDRVERLLFGNSLSNYPDALIPVLEVLMPQERKIYREVIKKFNHILTTIVLETLDQRDIRALVKELVEAEKNGIKANIKELSVLQ